MVAAADLQIHISHINYNGDWSDLDNNVISLLDAMREEQAAENKANGQVEDADANDVEKATKMEEEPMTELTW